MLVESFISTEDYELWDELGNDLLRARTYSRVLSIEERIKNLFEAGRISETSYDFLKKRVVNRKINFLKETVKLKIGR